MSHCRSLIVALSTSLTVCAALAAAQQSPSPPRKGGNPDAAKIVNPVVASPESISAGRRAYTQFCANCHGPSGKGDGSGAAGGTPPSDLTDAVWDYGSTDGEIFGVIHDGTGNEMGGYAERLKDGDIWNVVNYMRMLGRK